MKPLWARGAELAALSDIFLSTYRALSRDRSRLHLANHHSTRISDNVAVSRGTVQSWLPRGRFNAPSKEKGVTVNVCTMSARG